MDKNRFKRIIAKEGLIFIGFLVGAVLFVKILESIGQGGEGWALFLYPLYLLIRFISWAVRTLRQK